MDSTVDDSDSDSDSAFEEHLNESFEDEAESETAEETPSAAVADALSEGAYNARDVLSTCRIYPFLVDAVERTGTANVYEIDVQMAHLALQMTRVGMPVSASERERVGKHLRELRDAAATELQTAMEGAWEPFLRCVAQLQAGKARKGEPVEGTLTEAGITHSKESSYAERLEIRRSEFAAQVEKNGWSKKGLNLGAKIQQAALMRACGVPLLKVTEKTGLPKIDKETLEEMRQYPVARALLSWALTSAALRNFVENLLLDENGWLHPDWDIHKITGRWGSKPNCFDGETEVLTIDGWVRFADLKEGVRVAQYWKGDGSIDFVQPTSYVRERYEGRMVRLERRNIDLLVTPDHRLLLANRKTGEWKDVMAQDFVSDHAMPVAGEHAFDQGPDNLNFSWPYIAFLCAAQADGHYNGSGWKFGFTRKRKIKRFKRVLAELALPHTLTEEWFEDPFKQGKLRRRSIFYIHKSFIGATVKAELGPDKTFSPRLLLWSRKAVEILLDEIMYWDGSYTRRDCYSSSDKRNVDIVQALFVLTGRRARLRSYTGSKLQTKPNWQVDVTDKRYTLTSNTEKTEVPWNDFVYCLSVPSSYILVRRGLNVMVVGQCQNWSKRAGGGAENLRKMIVAPDGYTFIGADQRQLEARLIAADSGDPFLVGVFERGEDIHGAMAGVAFPGKWPVVAAAYKEHKGQDCGPSAEERKCDLCKLRDKLRDLAKRLEYGAFYGGSDDTLHSSVVKDFPELKRTEVQAFLKNVEVTMPRVLAWRAGLLEVAIKEGEIRSPILGRRQVFPMGRVEPTVIYNFRPQSGGADLWALGAIEFCKRWDQTAFEARIVHNGHDSVMILTREDLVSQVSADVCEAWQRSWNGVDFLMDVKVGKSWADT